jgi:pyrroloquinoline quinone biosynthesis protein E
MTAAPQALIAEVTHRCPLHCVYCSNPEQMQSAVHELSTEDWSKIIEQAAEIGCWHLHLTGGEPLLRRDAEQLVLAGRKSGLYVNLITSGLGLTRERVGALVEAGLDHIQLSFQDSEEAEANTIAGTRAHAKKLHVAEWIRAHRIAFTVNLVIHRRNIDRLEELIRFAEGLNADKLEIANVQYYGWALKNQAGLLPSREQLRASLPVIESARARLSGRMRIDYVLPDYYAKYPKPCMGGWGRGLMLIDPAGRAMPCHAAGVIPGLKFPDAAKESLRSIWEDSAAFNRFRGQDWMEEPCRSCERKTIDFGGCRCQAMLLTGEAAATDPVCSLSPKRPVVDSLTKELLQPAKRGPQWIYRIDPVA